MSPPAVRVVEPGGAALGTVVLTHGYLLDSRCWDLVLPWLTRAGWRALTWDLRGHGAARDLGPCTLDQAVDDLRGVVAGVVGPVALVGHSMGAMVTQAVLAAEPERVAAAALLATSPGGAGAAPLAAARWGAVVYRRPRALGRGWRVASRVAPARYRASAEAAAGYVPGLGEFVAPPVRYEGPMLLVGAGRDAFMPPSALTALRERYPRAEVLELPDVGHEVMLLAPTRVGRALAGLLARADVG